MKPASAHSNSAMVCSTRKRVCRSMTEPKYWLPRSGRHTRSLFTRRRRLGDAPPHAAGVGTRRRCTSTAERRSIAAPRYSHGRAHVNRPFQPCKVLVGVVGPSQCLYCFSNPMTDTTWLKISRRTTLPPRAYRPAQLARRGTLDCRRVFPASTSMRGERVQEEQDAASRRSGSAQCT